MALSTIHQIKSNHDVRELIEEIYNRQYIHGHVISNNIRGRRGRDRMVVGFTTTCAISVYHH